jgi:hypothetical protein
VEIKLNKEDTDLYSRLHVSGLDLRSAGYCLGILLKNGWHHKPWECRYPVYEQQSAFTSALVTAYARPFTKSEGWPRFPLELKNFDVEETALHKHMMELRHSIYAHSDSKHYKVIPWRAEVFSTDIVGGPWQRITALEGALLRKMIAKLQVAIQRKMKEMVPDAVQKPLRKTGTKKPIPKAKKRTTTVK